ncbi:hypothetical protein [Mesorhizobium sp.]|uniref:hypothetical protein n=1 Tax=Mesorhizobium sp. TaxID=1871066 RepID=UPI00120331B6|nr:hypothetical protein [Mesorhizobium sp.]TIO62969.1 MAG: hypothetical protein E5X79_01485 [Mesorhizobium sp.]
MTQLLAHANFSERLVPRSAQASQAPDRGAEAQNASAAFLHFTESGRPVATVPEQAAPAQGDNCAGADPSQRFGEQIEGQTVPAESLRPAGAVVLSTASRFILRLIAAHDGKNEADVLARLIATEGKAIGLSPLLAKAGDHLGDDLCDLPDFARRAQSRFSDCGADEAHGRQELRGLRR